MRLTVERDALLAAVTKVRGAANPKGTIPIVGYLLLEASGGTLTLTATNLDMQARAKAECQCDASGSLAVPVTSFFDAVKALPPGGLVALRPTPNGARLSIVCGRSRFELPVLPASDFPSFPTVSDAASGEIAASALARLFENTRFAISTEVTRYYLGGIYLHVFAGPGQAPSLRAVATDGHQLARSDCELPEGLGDMPGVILPKGLVAELLRHLGGGGPVALSVSPTMVRAEVAGVELSSKVIDGTFPDYRRVLPTDRPSEVSITRPALLGSLRRALVVANDEHKMVFLCLSAGSLIVKARSYDRGESLDELAVVYDGDPVTKAYNASYLTGMLELAGGDDVLLGFHDGDRLTVTEPADESRLMLVVAIQTAEAA